MTPATKADEGHDLNITEAEAAALCGGGVRAAREAALALYAFASAHAEARGIVLADTSSSSASIRDGVVTLGDEALTPDSSRFWPGDSYAPGGPQPSFDKQYVRDYCLSTGWDRTDPGPEVPDEVVPDTRPLHRRVRAADGDLVRRLSLRPEGGPVKATVLIRPKEGILDPQGEAVGGCAPHARIRGLRRPRRPARRRRARDADPAEAQAALESMARDLLANPLIESFTIELGDAS